MEKDMEKTKTDETESGMEIPLLVEFPPIPNYTYTERWECPGDPHTFIWSAGETNMEIPEGLPCVCGEYVAHYEICPTCGSKILKLVKS